MKSYENYLRFTRVDAVRETASGLLADLHGEHLRLDIIREDVVRIKISRGGVFDEQPSFAVAADPHSFGAHFAVEASDDVVRVRTARLVASLWLDPFRLEVHRPDGSAVVETARDEDGTYHPYATLNDAFTFARRCHPDDAVFGLGEKSGAGNRRGREFTLWNTDVLDPSATGEFTAQAEATDPRADPTSVEFDPYYVSIPFAYHQDASTGKVSASFVDNGYRGTYDFSPADCFRVHFSGGQYTEYVFAGPDMPGILEAYTWLTGRTQLPPIWSLGYHQCRWHRYTQADVEAIAARLRREGLPCDALWLDIEYMDGYRVFTWDGERFPDPEGFMARLDAEGYRLISIVDPGVKAEPGYEVYDDAVQQGVLCRTEGGDIYIGQVWPGNTAFPDFATEEARAWWGELNAHHVQSGLAGIWNDMNEPATGVISPLGMRFGKGEHSHERFHNQYALLMAMGTTQGLLSAMPDKRTFILSRAGSPGIQRYAANWMGDNLANWDHLRVSIPMATGFGISGQAFVGADIGGFFGHTNAELFARWFQYGALTPFCRNHSNIGTRDQYPWSFGPAVLEIVRDALELRYRLLPYLYASFVRAAETGAPVQRPLVFDHQYDPITADIDDEYLFGPDLLVAPVLGPGITSRQVYLPAGHWYEWHSDRLHAGQRHVVAETPMDRIPLYARAGAVIPMWAEAPPSTYGYAPGAVELHVFAPAEDGAHESFLQEDDGLTLAAADGARVRTEFAVSRAGRRVTVDAGVTGAGFPGFARGEFVVVLHGASPPAATVDGVKVTVEGGRLTIRTSGQPFRLEFEA
ncbi:TIM-barrel domain-containing protein [Sinomonas sp. ASV322]|uniref:glycoside hydrolase family 31 protein n=1 Tax=Sinomonas sp. ASV322 TaxID=3041920 RepID=UPI0027DDBC89|nr:TIM-barrel domain-containing protein [Sinomonas sp. ASV322]MDQ4503592.1 glycoside hydrolase family 31 protein [Sinomonas sp. ASV322]